MWDRHGTSLWGVQDVKRRGLVDGGQDARGQGSWPMGDAWDASGSIALAWGHMRRQGAQMGVGYV